jgi:hypothetical protein
VHPFWVVTDDPDLERAARSVVNENGVILYHENIAPGFNGFWVEAKDLREGDVFIGANGELSTLVSNERVEFPDGITVYNFTVDGNHNYFIIAQTDEYGQTCILVHNANPCANGYKLSARDKRTMNTMRPGHANEQSQINAIKNEFNLTKDQLKVLEQEMQTIKLGKQHLDFQEMRKIALDLFGRN